MPPYLARHLQNAAELMPWVRHSSGTGVPASACLSTAMIWLSVKRDISSREPPLLDYEKIPLLASANLRGRYPIAIAFSMWMPETDSTRKAWSSAPRLNLPLSRTQNGGPISGARRI